MRWMACSRAACHAAAHVDNMANNSRRQHQASLDGRQEGNANAALFARQANPLAKAQMLLVVVDSSGPAREDVLLQLSAGP